MTGGLLWYRDYLITSSYSVLENEDEIRLYPRDFRLDNTHVKIIKMNSQILLLNVLKNLLLVFCANSQIRIYNMTLKKEKGKQTFKLQRAKFSPKKFFNPYLFYTCIQSYILIFFTLFFSLCLLHTVFISLLFINPPSKMVLIARATLSFAALQHSRLHEVLRTRRLASR